MGNELRRKLSPSILAADFAILGEQVKLAEEAGADMIHFDVMDGMFVPSISFGSPVLKSVRKITDIKLDVHLMIEEPLRYIDRFVDCGADNITIHVEACKDVFATLAAIKKRGVDASICVNPSTPVEEIYRYLDDVSMVLIMTVEPGFGGQKYMDMCTSKVRTLRNYMNETGRCIDIEVDGGITKDNVNIPLEAGANVIVAGTAVFGGDISENVRSLKKRFEE